MNITPETVLGFKAPTKGFLCPLSANTFGIEFQSFNIRDYDTKRVIFQVSKDDHKAALENIQLADMTEDSYRKIKYNFSTDVLKTATISTTLTFAVGSQEVEDFRMIERHYFKDQLIKSYDFTFGFCIPNSTNTWEAVYAVPLLEDSLVDQMVAEPYATRSDSFYFVNDKLVMHNKAEYAYAFGSESKMVAPGAPGAKAKTAAKGMKYAAKMAGGAGRAEARAIPAPESKSGAKAI